MSTRRGLDDVLLGVLGVALLTFLLLAVGGLLAAVVSGHGLPTHHVEGALTAFAHFGDPSFAWRVAVGPAWLYWSCTAIVVSGGVMVTVFAAKYLRNERRE